MRYPCFKNPGEEMFWKKQFPRKILPALSLTKKTFLHHHAMGGMILYAGSFYLNITRRKFECNTQKIFQETIIPTCFITVQLL